MLENFLKKIERRPLLYFLLVVGLCILAIPGIKSIHIRSDITTILPESVPQVRVLKEQLRHYSMGSAGYLVLVRGRDIGSITHTAKVFSDSLKGRVPQALSVFGMDTSFVNLYGLWLMDPNFMKTFAEKFTGTAPHQILAAINEILETSDLAQFGNSIFGSPDAVIRGFINVLDCAKESPEVIRSELPGRLQQAFSGPPLNLSPDGKAGLFTVILQSNSGTNQDDFTFAQTLRDLATVLSKDSISISVTGNMMIAYDESTSIKHDLLKSAVGTITLIVLFLILMYRRIVPVIIITLSLAVSLIISAGIICLLTGSQIHVVTAAFILILIGLGVDFSIHLTQTRLSAKDPTREMTETLKLLALAAGSTSIVFLCLMLTGLAPLAQLGWVVAVGLVISLITTGIFVPVVVRLLPQVSEPKAVLKTQLKLPRLLVGLCIGILGLGSMTGFYYLSRTSIEKDIRKLSPRKLPSLKAFEQIVKTFNIYPAALRIELRCNDSLETVIKDLTHDPLIKSIGSPLSLLPTKEKKVTVNKAFTLLLKDTTTVTSSPEQFKEELHRLRLNFTEMGQLSFLGGEFGLYQYFKTEIGKNGRIAILDSLARTGKIENRTLDFYEKECGRLLQQRLMRMCSAPQYTLSQLPSILKDRYLPIDSARKRCLSYIQLNRDIWQDTVMKDVRKHLVPKLPTVTGTALLSYLVVEKVIQRGKWALLIGVIICIFLLTFTLRSIQKTILGITPIILGLGCTGFIFYFGESTWGPIFNYISVCTFALITGIGLDYSIHALAAKREDSRRVGKSIFVSGITSIIGFGGIAASNHLGLRGLGLSLCVGLLVCLLFALVLMSRK